MSRKKTRSKRKKNPAAQILAAAKHRGASETTVGRSIPPWILEEVRKAEASTPRGELPAAVLKPFDTPEEDALVVERLAHFMRAFDVEAGGS